MRRDILCNDNLDVLIDYDKNNKSSCCIAIVSDWIGLPTIRFFTLLGSLIPQPPYGVG